MNNRLASLLSFGGFDLVFDLVLVVFKGIHMCYQAQI